MAININPPLSTPLAPQDPSGAQGGAAAPTPGAAASTTDGEAAGADAPSPADQIAAHAGLVAQASQTTQNLAGANPDLDGEGARLLALHLQQTLSTQNLSIANQAPQALLSLLR